MRLSVHLIDFTNGVPATEMDVLLRSHVAEDNWWELVRARTDDKGWVDVWTGPSLETGVYQLQFDLDGYYALLGMNAVHPRLVLEFRVSDPEADLHLQTVISAHSFLCIA